MLHVMIVGHVGLVPPFSFKPACRVVSCYHHYDYSSSTDTKPRRSFTSLESYSRISFRMGPRLAYASMIAQEIRTLPLNTTM